MAWSAPGAGAAPYQPQPYTNGQSGYGQQPPFQYGQQPAYGHFHPGPTFPAPGPPQRPPNLQPPKKKGNPIITRYPPPPGYRGPAQPQGPYGANQYPSQFQPPQPLQPGYGQPVPAPSVWPSQGYSAPPTPAYSPQGYGPPQTPTYPQQPFPQAQAQNYQWHQQGYQPNQQYPPAQNHPGGQGYAPPASNYPSYQPQPSPVDSNQNFKGQTPGWSQPNGQAQHPPSSQYPSYNGPVQGFTQGVPQGYDPNATPTPISAHPVPHQAMQPPPQPASATEGSHFGDKSSLHLESDDWDFDFEGAIWPKSNEPVDPALSLGVIIWHPAKQVTRALPSTFDEAEEQALKPTPDKLDNGESVSMYFTHENSHEAFLDVRQTDEWESIQDDPIFVVFTDEDMHRNLVSLEDCIGQRDRPDEHFLESQRDRDEEMPDASWSVMDNLEQVLRGTNGDAPRSRPIRPKTESPPVTSQEDILAKLGVTGAPKPPSDELMPMPFPSFDKVPRAAPLGKQAVASSLPSVPQPPQQSAQTFNGHPKYENVPTAQQPYGQTSSGHPVRFPPPPPPPPPEPQRYGAWNQPQYNGAGYDGSRGSPAPSEGSNHTMAGSDFEPEKPNSSAEREISDIPAQQQRDSSFSRKRSYEDADHGNERPRQLEDHTKRKRRSQVDAAYSRR